MTDFKVYDESPDKPEVLISLAKTLADSGQHDAAMLLSEEALRLPYINKDQKRQILDRMTVSGFYSKLPPRRELGKYACETIFMDRSLPWATRAYAGQNGTWYAPSAKQIMPSTILKEVGFFPSNGYRPMNPSIYRWKDQLWMIQRTVNYLITPSGHYDMQGDTAIKTINWLLRLNNDLSIASAHEILPPLDMPEPLYGLVLGFEDCRLFVWQDALWCTSTVRELNAPGNCQIVMARIDPDEQTGNYRYSNWRVMHPKGVEFQHQKNWMPLINNDDLYFVYSSDPVRIIDHNCDTISIKPTSVASDSFRGGSQAIQFDDGWLAIIHESHIMPDNRRKYMHRFAWYDSSFRLASYTESFYIHTLGIEFAAGIAVNPKTNDIVVSFGLADKDSWFAVFKPQEIRNNLNKIDLIEFKLPPDEKEWVESQTNTALQDKLSVDTSTTILAKLGLKQHEDKVKNWDNLQSLLHTINTTDKNEWIMDVASTPGSAYLDSLQLYGYKNLMTINLTNTETKIIEGIHYQYGDCTKTNFPDNHFGFISCLSVIEHGVNVVEFLRESSRIIKTGGHLYVSTDYWQDKVDTRNQMAFGAPVKVFTRSDIEELIAKAAEFGLTLTSEPNLSCKDRVVNWIGMDYTFISLLFRKV